MSTVLKWMGGKSTLMGEISRVLPPGKRLIEPFAGSCAVTLGTDYEDYIIADINQDLINLYIMVRDEPDELTRLSAEFFSFANTESEYYRLRDLFNERSCNIKHQSALFLYLNRHCYRGLCRYNKRKGEYNSPYGHYKKPYFPEKEILTLSQKLQKATIVCSGFQGTLALAEAGDVIYCDPPYIKKGRFTQYHSTSYGLSEQRELINMLESMLEKGISVVASSHDDSVMRHLYLNFAQKKIIAHRSVGVAAGAEKKAVELILYRIARNHVLARSA
ncbi:Dam family site-specific DNA-(adenine-N6)-methyltransferase [Cronobacter dublinensis subsp. dublinensis]|nr:Dam family site-specific DNA-(adenine-N6)-methyltransferase [Cronobacter dublinensis subsp. dublinensis]EGT5729691.1 Dam family site-specific DNA-(adenine-N6)-methyltransferase [Cronobacter dublinensis subsp. dublinensis]